MCATFEIEKTLFIEKMQKINIQIENIDFNLRILPHSNSPTILKKNGNIQLELMNYSLIPSWSKERKPKFATHNARIESLMEKPTWKNLVGKKHCLVPLTCFIEPIYTGEYAGNMLKFKLDDCYLVPGLYDVWHDKSTGEVVDSYAIITGEPAPFVGDTGHDRSPIFIDQDIALNWLNTEKNSSDYFLRLLEKKQYPKFSVEIDRKMKSGWEKRI